MMTELQDRQPSARISLGLLDFCEASDGIAEHGIFNTIETAILADRLGYKRYWIAEHWSVAASTPSPEILCPMIAGMTEHIRVGPAGVLLSFYSPMKVASNALLAERLFPGRTDLGLARAGVAPEIARALTDKADAGRLIAEFSSKVNDVVSYLEGRGPVATCPGGGMPEVWVLGSSGHSAPLAAQIGGGFALSLFHAGAAPDPAIIPDLYHRGYRSSSARGSGAKACIAIAGFCADNDSAAQRMALSHTNLFIRPNIIGTPQRWREEIVTLCRRFAVDEVVVLELSPASEDHRWAITALANVFALNAALASA